jgi:hypothetical protein
VIIDLKMRAVICGQFIPDYKYLRRFMLDPKLFSDPVADFSVSDEVEKIQSHVLHLVFLPVSFEPVKGSTADIASGAMLEYKHRIIF